jgi:hypothetical protein
VELAANLLKVDGGLGVFHVQRFQVLDDDAGDGQIAKPLVIGGNDEPWRVRCAAAGERIFVAGHVFLPIAALLVIGFADLPVLGGVVEALLEALQLFFLGDVQIKLENVGVVINEVLLEVVDEIIAPGPDCFGTRL